MVTETPLPRLLLAAASSATGKTTIATGLMAALRSEGIATAGFKVGPDYIDPGWHALATGRPGRNLDAVLTSDGHIPGLLAHGSQSGPEPAEIAIIEGAMGLFDGAFGTAGVGSSAHVAALTATPVVLIVDASKVARTAGAVVHGLATFDPALHVAGVIVNNVVSARHEQEVLSGLADTGVPVLGVVPKQGSASLASRHLGLVTAAEYADRTELVETWQQLIENNVNLNSVLQVAYGAAGLPGVTWDPAEHLRVGGFRQRDPQKSTKPVVAVFGGKAFTFRYAEHAELLTAAGIDLVEIDPATDDHLPAEVSGIIIGGGFPEEHAAAVSENETLRKNVAAAVSDGVPTVAECAGFAYLCQSLDGAEMCGVLPAEAHMSNRLTLGYRQAVIGTTGPLGQAGTRVSGHEFHRTVVTPSHGSEASFGPAMMWQGTDGMMSDGFGHGTLHASYLHHHWVGSPTTVATFADQIWQKGNARS